MQRPWSSRPKLALHPYRKRKFFYGLAELLGEDRPGIKQKIHAPSDPLSNKPLLVAESQVTAPAKDESEVHAFVAMSEEESSFDCVEFGAPASESNSANPLASSGSRLTQSSQGSVADSGLSLVRRETTRYALDTSTSGGEDDDRAFVFHFQHGEENDHVVATATALVNRSVVQQRASEYSVTELRDYYDCDRFCEIAPCWLYSEASTCAIHQGCVRRPMLLFSLQVMDEFIAFHSLHGGESWRVQACKTARAVFASMWEADGVVNASIHAKEIVLQDYLLRKETLVGVAYEVWRVIDRYWAKYRQNNQHHDELFFADASNSKWSPTAHPSKWSRTRDLMQIYGIKTSQATRLAAMDEDEPPRSGADELLSEKQLVVLMHRDDVSMASVQVGIEFLSVVLQSSPTKPAAAAAHKPRPPFRAVISQSEWKVAFNAIQIHLQKWRQCVQVFPCGSFSRGAAYGSVVDILVALPESNQNDGHDSESGAFEEIVAALSSAKIIQKRKLRRLSGKRGACVLEYKKSRLLLDLKVFHPPKSWFALLFFTGPESFAREFFSSLLKMELRELPDTSFECVYHKLVDTLAPDALRSVESEKDVFDLLDREYLFPSSRM